MVVSTEEHQDASINSGLNRNKDSHMVFTKLFETKKKHAPVQKIFWERFSKKGLPHKKMEDWNWSDLRFVLFENQKAEEKKPKIKPGIHNKSYAFSDYFIHQLKQSKEIHFIDLDSLMSDKAPKLPEGVQLEIASVEESLENYTEIEHSMANLAMALVDQVYIFRVKAHKKINRPVLLYKSANQEHYQMVIKIIVEEGAELPLIEICGENQVNQNIIRLITVHKHGNMQSVLFQPENPDCIQTYYDDIHLEKKAVYQQTGVNFGAFLSRLETKLSMDEDSASVDIKTAYLLRNHHHIDLNQKVDCNARNSHVRIVTKGIVTDHSKAAFQGYFNVQRTAQKTDATMKHHALVLSNKAKVNAKPCLEIYADDVSCAHGNTSGNLDPQALFYMRQRGLSEKQAKVLLMEAFILEILDAFSDKNSQFYFMGALFLNIIRNWLKEHS